jgi:integrase
MSERKKFKRTESPYWQGWVQTATGQKVARSSGTTNARAADLELDRLENDLCSENPPWKLGEALEESRKQQELERRKPSTIDRGRISGAHLVNVLGGDLDLNNCNPGDIVEHYLKARRDMGVTDHTIAKEFAFLRIGLRRGKRPGGKFTGDPKSFWPSALKESEYYRPRKRVLTPEDFAVLLDTEKLACERYSYQVPRADWLIAYVLTGCRHEELHRVQKTDVDLGRRVLFIDGTKTKDSRREVPILDDLVPVLERRMLTDGPMLFAPRWQRGRMHRNLKVWCAAAGLEPLSCNDLRRTFATWMSERDVPESLLLRFMGHKSSRMLRAVYAQGTDRMREATIEKFGALYVRGASVIPIEKARELRGLEKAADA